MCPQCAEGRGTGTGPPPEWNGDDGSERGGLHSWVNFLELVKRYINARTSPPPPPPTRH